MGRHHIWRGKLDTFIECIHVTLQLTVNGLSMMSISPFASFNSHAVPDKSCVMKLTTLYSVRTTLWGNPFRILAHAIRSPNAQRQRDAPAWRNSMEIGGPNSLFIGLKTHIQKLACCIFSSKAKYKMS